jgi:hypothetical protein
VRARAREARTRARRGEQQAEREAAVERSKPTYAIGSIEWLAERKKANEQSSDG